MTWFDIVNAAKTELDLTVPKIPIDARTLLAWASRAQNILQGYSRAVRRTCPIELDVASTDGAYCLSNEQRFHTITFLDYQPTGTTPITTNGMTPGGFRIPILTWDQFYKIQNSGLLNPQSSAFSTVTPDSVSSSIVAGVRAHKIYFNPKTAYTGTVNVTFVPQLTEYSPSAAGEWKLYGSDPASEMKVKGPEVEFAAALPGIISFTKAQMLLTMPRFNREYKDQYDILMQNFEEAKHLCSREQTDYNHYEPPPVDLGGVF